MEPRWFLGCARCSARWRSHDARLPLGHPSRVQHQYALRLPSRRSSPISASDVRQTVFVVGGGNSGGQAALHLSKYQA